MSVSTADRLIASYALIGAANKRSLEQLRLVLTEFQAHGIMCVLLKGADLITRLYGVWGLRPMVDVDLLVRERDLPTIDQIMKNLDYRQQIDGNPAYRSAEGTLALDLITEIWYRDDTEGIWQRAVQRDLDGVPVKGMGAEDLLIFLTAYTVLHRGCFSSTFSTDLALLVKKEPLDWEFIADEASRCHVKVPLFYGLSYAARRESILIPDHVLARLTPSGTSGKLLAWLLHKLVTVRLVEGLGHFLLFITQSGSKQWRWLQKAFYPSTAFLKYRYGERGTTHPTWTRLKRACSLVGRVQFLLAQVFFQLLKRTRSRCETTIQTLEPGHLTHSFSIVDLVPFEDFGAVHHLFSFKVVSWSMFPTILKDDMIGIESAHQIRIGDVVVFRQMGALVCHRVTGLGAAGELYTNGEQAEGPGTRIQHPDVVGKVTTITRGGKRLHLDSLPEPSAASFLRMKGDRLFLGIRQHLLSLTLRGIEFLKQIPPVRNAVAFALWKIVGVSVGVRVPVQLIQAYRFWSLGRMTPPGFRPETIPAECRATDDLILLARLGRFPLGTFRPATGEIWVRRVAAGLGLEECLRNLNQQMQSAWPSSRS